jgi:hypothetical protein
MLVNGKRPDRVEFLNRVLSRLDSVQQLPGELRRDSQAKAELAAMVFEDQGDAAPPNTYERLLEALANGLDERHCTPWPKLKAIDALLRDLAWLDRGLDRVDERALNLRLKTGLDQPLAPVEIETPALGCARSLIAELKDDEELGGMARLAELLLAAVQLPTPVSQPEELPLGGVTDISNRGSLDRLLLSELAHDSLTLAVRVAMNEALYLRRETPPRQPTRRRLVLLDAGLRMWGVPRVFATATGLALAAGAKPGFGVQVFRAAGSDLAPVDMTTAAGLNEHLAVLDHRAHPGEALPALRERLNAAADDDEADVVLVTGDDVLADRAFQRALTEANFPQIHLAAVDRNGRFQLHLQSARGRKLLREAQFSLDDILQPRKKPTVQLLADSAAPLPAIFRAERFPLLLSVQPDPKRSWLVRGIGVLTYARDGRLMLWNDRDHGARQLAEGLPAGHLLWAESATRDAKVRAVIGRLSERGLYALTYDFETGICKLVRLTCDISQPGHCFMLRNAVFVVGAQAIAVIDAESGQSLTTSPYPRYLYHRGRFFRKREGTGWHWYAVAFDGNDIVWELLFNEDTRRISLLAIFDAVRKENPVGVTAAGELISIGSDVRQRTNLPALPGNMHVLGISRDGSKILFAYNEASARKRTLIDVHTLAATPQAPNVDPLAAVEWENWKWIHPVTLRRRFEGLGVSASGELILIGRRDSLWPLRLDERDQRICLATQPVETELAVSRRFEVLDQSAANRYSLSVAAFEDGSRAVLDARGLLHLKSSDPELPECTIVLIEGPTSGWASDGRYWGTPYFVGPSSLTDDREIYEQILRPFTERLR